MAKTKITSELLYQAAMNIYQYNTGVVHGTDGTRRVMVSQAIDDNWGDCVGLAFMNEGERNWYFMHLSPARARIVAYELLRRAKALEKSGNPGMECIDKQD